MSKNICNNKKRHCLKDMRGYVPEEKWKSFMCKIDQLIKDQEEESFIAGYCYAIQVLQDGLKKETYIEKDTEGIKLSASLH